MKLKDYAKEDLELMSYSEIAELILNDKGSSMKIVDVFKKICKLLELSDAEFEARIADFFELISTDKNFLVLDKGYCDLRKKHTPKVIVEDEEEEEIIEPEASDEEEEEVVEDAEDDIFYDSSSDKDDVDDGDDELSDFMLVDEEEETTI